MEREAEGGKLGWLWDGGVLERERGLGKRGWEGRM